MENDQTENHQAPDQPVSYCPLCQSEIAADANFCAYCGKQIRRSGLDRFRWAGYLAMLLLVVAGLWFYFQGQQQSAPPNEPTKSERPKPVIAPKEERRIAPATPPSESIGEVSPALADGIGHPGLV